MNSMIERVGRALAAEEGYAYDPVPCDRRARAAIAAMREPTPATLLAGWEASASGKPPVLVDQSGLPWVAEGGTVGFSLEYDNKGPDALVSAYVAMIDAALKPDS
jgi:glycosyltransferase involved in cell wall biosynthesis